MCRKLDLKPGMRVLDVGCGWGGMVLHAAKNYGVDIIGVTLSKPQAEWGQQAVVDAGLGSKPRFDSATTATFPKVTSTLSPRSV